MNIFDLSCICNKIPYLIIKSVSSQSPSLSVVFVQQIRKNFRSPYMVDKIPCVWRLKHIVVICNEVHGRGAQHAAPSSHHKVIFLMFLRSQNLRVGGGDAIMRTGKGSKVSAKVRLLSTRLRDFSRSPWNRTFSSPCRTRERQFICGIAPWSVCWVRKCNSELLSALYFFYLHDSFLNPLAPPNCM